MKIKLLISFILTSIIVPVLIYGFNILLNNPVILLKILTVGLLAILVGFLYGAIFCYIMDLLYSFERNRRL